LYGALVRLRLLGYRRGWFKTQALGAPAIAVGNLTAGGTGKTPVVSWLLQEAAAAGIHAACLTRGYGRETQSTWSRVRAADGSPLDPLALGDEVAMLAMAHLKTPFFIGGDRVAAARLACVTDAPALFVLDDAYQHLRAGRDLNVLLVDAQSGFGNGRMLPLGPLREPLREVRRADVVLITKANLGSAAAVASELRHFGVSVPVFCCDYRATRIDRLDGQESQAVEALAGKSVALLCGIARPDAFRTTVAALGASVERIEVRPDHHGYPPVELERLAAAMVATGDTVSGPSNPLWLTTEKDAVKLRGRLAPEACSRLWVLAMEAVPEPDARAFFLDRLRALTLK
jgi:tetraacyldisaccharide 4'-kinase